MVYLHWDEPFPRRASYTTLDEALAQAEHDLRLGVPTQDIRDQHGTVVDDLTVVRKRADAYRAKEAKLRTALDDAHRALADHTSAVN